MFFLPTGGVFMSSSSIERLSPTEVLESGTSKNAGLAKTAKPKYPGIPLTTNGNQLVCYFTEARIAEAGVFYPITPSTEMGENFELSFAKGELNVFGQPKIAIEAEGEHAAQGGAIAYSVTGKRVVNFTSGQGVVYGLEQYYHAPGKMSTMVVEIAARALTKHALNVHCGHDDIYAALDTGWSMTFAMDAQQAADQAVIMRRVNELSLNPGMNIQDGFLTSHLERTFRKCEAELLREYLGRPDDIIECPTEAQRALFGPTRRRVPECIDLKHPALLGSVQNQEHYMVGVAARRQNFVEPILGFFEEAYEAFGRLTGRYYGLISEYKNDDAETVFVCLGSSAENCHAAVDYIREKDANQKVGVIHVNVLRPFPEAKIVTALAGKKNVVVLERMDDQTAGDGPLARDIRTALAKALENHHANAHAGIPAISEDQVPRIFSGVYGLGSRDFRPEGILGAYEFVTGKIARQDGKKVSDGVSFFYVGINHPYNVESADKPSLLPDGAIAIRFHSIGGWGMITTGKNLSEMLGEMGDFVGRRDHADDPDFQALHVSANPKYGSEKKGAPTNYFLVAAPERIRVNCDLHHVNVVLCCDPKIFTHTDPLVGLEPGGAFVWESSETKDKAVWERIPPKYRKELLDKNIRLYVLNGFKVARESTNRADLQYRMQGNSFLGAFFKVSSFLNDNKIPVEKFHEIVHAQYEKKFGRFGEAVVASNMKVMEAGFAQVREVKPGRIDAEDRSSMRGERITPLTLGSDGVSYPGETSEEQDERLHHYMTHQNGVGTPTNGSGKVNGNGSAVADTVAEARPPFASRALYDHEFRGDYGYNQPASPLASTGVIAAATGETVSKYVARRVVPKWIAENCTQCMDCITACPDTALPNTAQDMRRVLDTMVFGYVENEKVRDRLHQHLGEIESASRKRMLEKAGPKVTDAPSFAEVIESELDRVIEADSWFAEHSDFAETGIAQFRKVLETVPFAYQKITAIFKAKESKAPGEGGIFGIFVDDRCKGCGECVVECGDHEALVMIEETEEVEGAHASAIGFLDELPNTPAKYLGKFNPDNIAESKAAALQFHLMVRDNYEALRGGDGACAGCGEKSILRAVATMAEAFLRPMFHAKADRLDRLADELENVGVNRLEKLKASKPNEYANLRKAILHIIMGYGGENDADTDGRIATKFKGTDADLVDALQLVLRQDAHNHRDIQAVDGGLHNGMSVMAMAASTGCNTVYGSTHPNNPHPYPWMNSLFQDGPTVGWLFSESFIDTHARQSVVPERLTRSLLSEEGLDEKGYFKYTRFTDADMTDDEVNELPRVWTVGGDGALGDIGYQNLSKAIMQNRPNHQIVMLDTQVYSNTGGQNSESSPMTGGFDMNQFGAASEGKLTEMKSVSQSLMAGHGSALIAQVSMANSATLFSTILEGMLYRGTAYIQAYSTCQPEHGVADDMATEHAKMVRDSRGLPEFIYNPTLGEGYDEALSLKGNPANDRDWWTKQTKVADKFKYTIANWASQEPRFRQHFHKVDPNKLDELIHLDKILLKITQQDTVHRRFKDPNHRSYVPEPGVYTMIEGPDGQLKPIGLSRQMVLFCVERRKSWRMLQSKAGIVNYDRRAQERVIREFDAGKIPNEVFHDRVEELVAVAFDAEKKGDKKTPVMDLLEATANQSAA